MKIAVLTSSYPRYPGDGTAPFVKSICETMVTAGHQVEVVAPFDMECRPMDTKGVSLHRFKYIWPDRWHIMGHARSLDADVRLLPLTYLLLPFFLLSAFIQLLIVTGKQRSEIIHVHWVLPNGPVAALVAGLRHIPFVVSLHGSDIYMARKKRIFGFMARWVFSRSAAVTACSPELKQGASELGAPKRTVLLAWGADPEVFKPLPDQMEERKKWGLNGETIVIAAMGRMVYKKGFEILIQAMPAVLKKHPEVWLAFAGDGPLLPNLKELACSLDITSNVLFRGRIPWTKAPEFLATADIFVLPSVRDTAGNLDGMPTVLLEAMSCGIPVVASRIGGIPLAIKDGENGILVNPGSVEELTQALMKLIEAPPDRKVIGLKARETILQDLNWGNVVRRITELFETALAMNDPKSTKGSIPSSDYTKNYYEEACDGCSEFLEDPYQTMPARLVVPLQLAGLKPGMRVVDLGCGRGEVVYHAVMQGAQAWGLDYSEAAVQIANSKLKTKMPTELSGRYLIQLSDARHLPFPDNFVDRVFMLDIVEHLNPAELASALREVYRILKPGGSVVVHTMPSLWYYRYGYPIYRIMQRARKKSLPANPRDRCSFSYFHVNEQTPLSLRKTLRNHNFKTRVWLKAIQDYSYERNQFVRMGMSFLAKVFPFNLIFCNDIFAIGEK